MVMLVLVEADAGLCHIAGRIGWKTGDPPARLQEANAKATEDTLAELVSVARIKARNNWWRDLPEPPIPEGYDPISVAGLTCYLLIDTDKWDVTYRMLVDVPVTEAVDNAGTTVDG
jgi:hypothetical protein